MEQKKTRWIFSLLSLFLGLVGTTVWLLAVNVWNAQSAEEVASLSLSKTVGTNSGVCATMDSITVGMETLVTYCYEATNTGNENLVLHTVIDDDFGTLLSNFPYVLAPEASAFFTHTAAALQTANFAAKWRSATSGGVSAEYVDSAEVIVVTPSLEIKKTVGTDPSVCATTEVVYVPSGTQVTYCYEVTNTGMTDLVKHWLTDNELGSILNAFSYNLTPAASAFLTQTVTAVVSSNASAIWEGETPGGYMASGRDSAEVVIITQSYLPLVVK